MAQTHTRFPLRRKTDPARLAAARLAAARLMRAARELIEASIEPRTVEKLDVYTHWLKAERDDVQRMHERHMDDLQAERAQQGMTAIASRN